MSSWVLDVEEIVLAKSVLNGEDRGRVRGEPSPDRHHTDPKLDWVGPEPRGIASVITLTAGGRTLLSRIGYRGRRRTGTFSTRLRGNAFAQSSPRTVLPCMNLPSKT
ncbi:hypothetical protein A2U01_0011948 [Trifolium medium]|uniref:Uncharacterized protein n=1 Tax=Trifolium medium TaxID=97028 RepID=A0A392MXM6_9FABA|nr:hypothetical protein [Trifolium medium]